MANQQYLPTPLGHTLCSYWHEPQGAPRATVIIGAAIGIPQSYYQTFAAWLAGEGFRVVTFDYYGHGESLQGALRDVKCTLSDWAANDCASVLEQAYQQLPEQPLYWVGHSLGGQIVPFIRGNEKITKLITVACGSGYWKGNAKNTRLQALLLWKLIMPSLIPLYGYFPGKKLKLIGDLPANVARQWRRWCLNPRYAAGIDAQHQAAYSRFVQPVVGLAFTDDEMISAANFHTLHQSFDQAPVELRFFDPAQFAQKRIGHLGFFRSQHQEGAWRQCLLPELSPDTDLRQRA